MTIAERIDAQRATEFEQEFDLETLDKFVEEQISKYHYVEIGLSSEWQFENGYLKNEKQFKDWFSKSKWLSFADGYECYIWTTYCQIPQKFAKFVEIHLRKQGFKVGYRGACGYATYDIMEVKL